MFRCINVSLRGHSKPWSSLFGHRPDRVWTTADGVIPTGFALQVATLRG